jgi:integrase/recombinase XerC
MPNHSSPQTKQLVDEYLTRAKATTARHYRDSVEDFRRFHGGRDIYESVHWLLAAGFSAANSAVEQYKADMEGTFDKDGKIDSGRGLSAAAVNLRLTVLRGIVKKARKAGLIQWEIDVGNLPSEAVHDVAGPGLDVLNQMLDAAKAQPGPAGRRNYAILRLAGQLGLRRYEIVGLDLVDFDATAKVVWIHGKGRKQREKLSCSPALVDAIQAWLAVRPRSRAGSPLFTNLIPGRAERITGSAVYEIVKAMGVLAVPDGRSRKHKGIRPHGIRHTAITEAVHRAKGLGLAREEVQKFSRHKDFRMVARYLDADDEAQKKLAGAVGDVLH